MLILRNLRRDLRLLERARSCEPKLDIKDRRLPAGGDVARHLRSDVQQIPE